MISLFIINNNRPVWIFAIIQSVLVIRREKSNNAHVPFLMTLII